MRRMRAQVADNNIYRWAGMLLSEAAQLIGRNRSFPLVHPAVVPPRPWLIGDGVAG